MSGRAAASRRSGLTGWIRDLARGRARLLIAATIGAALCFALPGSLRWSTRLLLAWDAGTLLYIALISAMMMRSEVGDIRSRAKLFDENRFTILIMILLATVSSFGAIVAELVNGRSGGALPPGPMALAGVTVLLSWTFTHMVFAVHYAHEYYQCVDQSERGGLQFPNEPEPDYGDFLYFSFVIGCAAQTADVGVTSGAMRRNVLVHGVVAFLFNTAVLALSVNIAAGLIGSGGS